MNLVDVVLAAKTAVVDPPDPLSELKLLIGGAVLLQVGQLLASFVRWVGQRIVDRDDKARAEVELRVSELEKTIVALDKQSTAIQLEVQQALQSLQALQAGVTQLSGSLDTRLERQADHYRQATREALSEVTGKLAQFETSLRAKPR